MVRRPALPARQAHEQPGPGHGHRRATWPAEERETVMANLRGIINRVAGGAASGRRTGAPRVPGASVDPARGRWWPPQLRRGDRPRRARPAEPLRRPPLTLGVERTTAPPHDRPGRGSGRLDARCASSTCCPARRDAPVPADPDALYDAFATWVGEQGLTLYPAQEEALIELVSGANVILSTPTGTGKSLVATGGALRRARRRAGGRSTPRRSRRWSRRSSSRSSTSSAPSTSACSPATPRSTPQAPVICCTAEVLANIALREGAAADVGQVVMDEFHFYSEPDRGWAWQVPLLELPHAQFVLMSATLGDVTRFEADLTRRTGRADRGGHPRRAAGAADLRVGGHAAARDASRSCSTTHQAPVYVVHFTQASALERAQALTSVNVAHAGGEGPDRRADRRLPLQPRASARPCRGWSRHGIGVHHAGMLPKYRRLVEQLAQAGLLKVICGTDTLGRRHQRADPHRGADRPDEVRRPPPADAQGARVPPDRRARGPGGLRHRRHRRRAGARPRRGERTGWCPRPATTPRSSSGCSARSRPRAR